MKKQRNKERKLRTPKPDKTRLLLQALLWSFYVLKIYWGVVGEGLAYVGSRIISVKSTLVEPFQHSVTPISHIP